MMVVIPDEPILPPSQQETAPQKNAEMLLQVRSYKEKSLHRQNCEAVLTEQLGNIQYENTTK